MTMARSHLVDTSITLLVSLRYPLSPSRFRLAGEHASVPPPPRVTPGPGVWSWMGSRAERRRRSTCVVASTGF